MRSRSRRVLLAAVAPLTLSAPTLAQTLSIAESHVVVITRERIRPGDEGRHTRIESERPRVLAQAGSRDYYLALASMTGPPELWRIQPWTTYAAWDQARSRDARDTRLTTALAGVSERSADLLERRTVVEAVSEPDLSHGAEPNPNLVRFWQVTTVRVRLGYEARFGAVMRTYQAAVARTDPAAHWRVYRVVGGLPRGTYLIFSSVELFAEFDDALALDASGVDPLSPGERQTLHEFSMEGLRRVVANRFRLDPLTSFVPDATRAVDPAFWSGGR